MSETTTTVATVDPLRAALDKLLKPGTKTTEFLGLIAVYAGVLATLLGAFNTHSPRFNAILKVAALAAAAVSQVGYALSRGNVKAALSLALTELASAGVVIPVTKKRLAGDGGVVDLVTLIAGAFVLAGLIWLIVGFTHHTLDVFGLILTLVGVAIYILFGGLSRTSSFRRRP